MEHISGVTDSGEGKSVSQREKEKNAARDVGNELREVRLKAGRALKDIAAELRIRADHLEAIEDGELDRLPGTAYAVGFARSYANYLGVDAGRIVSAIKARPDGSVVPERLVFPEPMDESRVPKASVLLASAIVVALAYAGWYTIGGTSGGRTPTVAEVPPELSVLAGTPVASPPAEGAATQETAQDLSATLSTRASAPEPDVVTKSAKTAAPGADTTASAAAAPKAVAQTDEGPAQPAPTAPAPAEQAEAAEPALETAALAAPDSPPSSPEMAASLPTSTLSGSVPQARAQSMAGQAPAAQTAGSQDLFAVSGSERRVVLRARNDTWIYVASADGDTLFEGVLRRGESYTVPHRKGLVLTTADAGSLEIVVDGSPLGAFGPEGSIRRQLSLDIERLLSDRPSSME